jgi:hypothetical protein
MPKGDTVGVVNMHTMLRRVYQTRWRNSHQLRGGGFSGSGDDSPLGFLGLPPLLLWLTRTCQACSLTRRIVKPLIARVTARTLEGRPQVQCQRGNQICILP